MTTLITDTEIETLMNMAGAHEGAGETVALCRVALGLDDDITDRSAGTLERRRAARARCAEIIAEAAAMAD